MSGLAHRSLKEAIWILGIWVGFASWVLGYAAVHAYPKDPSSMGLTFGLPTWVVWGILVPWILATMITIWFCLFVMEDHQNEADGDE